MLLQQFLPAIRQILSKFFIFQQDNVPLHRRLEVIDFNHLLRAADNQWRVPRISLFEDINLTKF